MSLKPQADHTMCLRLRSDDMRGTESLMVIKKSSENCISILSLGLNISIKLNKMLIDAFLVFLQLHRPFEATFYEITFGRRLLREERESPFVVSLCLNKRKRARE